MLLLTPTPVVRLYLSPSARDTTLGGDVITVQQLLHVNPPIKEMKGKVSVRLTRKQGKPKYPPTLTPWSHTPIQFDIRS